MIRTTKRRRRSVPRLSPFLYRGARRVNTFEAWLSLSTRRIARRYLNKFIGKRLLAGNRLGRIFRLW
jgi:hypothetical protein